MPSIYLSSTGDKEFDAWLLIRQVYELCDAVQKRECRMVGITPSAFDVLYVVKSQPKPLTAYRVAGLLGHRHHSVVELVNRLRGKGLLERCMVNGKSSLEITAAGDKVLVRALSRPLLADTIHSIGSPRVQQLVEDLMPLRKAAMRILGLIDGGEVRLQPVAEMIKLTNTMSSMHSKEPAGTAV